MRVRRWGLGCLATLLASGLAVVSGPAGAEDAATLSVPDNPSGDVVVTATADPAVAPYLQVKLVRDWDPSSEFLMSQAIAPAPVKNQGEPLSVDVPTWGLDGGFVDTFALYGCSSSEADKCTALLATQERAITQLVKPTGISWDVPEEPIFWPDEPISVTADYDGGGRFLLWGVFNVGTGLAQTRQPLPAHGTSIATDLSPDANRGGLRVSVCSELSDAYCAIYSQESVRYVGAHSLYVVRTTRTSTLISDPGLVGAHIGLDVYAMADADRLTWLVRDGEGHALTDPVEVALPSSYQGLSQLDLNPVAAVDGPMPDGDYTVEFTAHWTKGYQVAEATGTQPITVLADPPADQPAIYVARRAWRYRALRQQATPRFEVQMYPGTSGGEQMVRVLDGRGRVVERAAIASYCADGDECAHHPSWLVDFDDLGTPSFGSGRYRVELKMPDSYGRPMTVRLGRIEMWKIHEVGVGVTSDARRAQVSRGEHSRVFELVVPHGARLDSVNDVRVGVKAAPGTGSLRTYVRVPGFRDSWRQGHRITREGGWTWVHDLIAWYHPLRRVQKDFLGRTVQIKVRGAGVERVSMVRLQADGYVWRRP